MGVIFHVLLHTMNLLTNLTTLDPKYHIALGSLPENSIPVEKTAWPSVTTTAATTTTTTEPTLPPIRSTTAATKMPKQLNLDGDDLTVYKDYIQQGKDTLAEIKELMERDGWKTTRKAKNGVSVKYLFMPNYGRRIYLTEAIMPAPPEVLFQVIWHEGGKMNEWNPSVEKVEILKHIGDIAQISWQVAANQAGGFVAQRDFVVLNEKDEEDTPNGKVYYVSYVSTTWDGKPPVEDFVRAENGPSGFKFEPIPGEPDKTRVLWVFNADLKFEHMPDAVLNAVLPGSTMNYMKYLKTHLEEMKGSARKK